MIRLLLESKPSDYQKILWSPCTAATMWLGALEYNESLEKLLETFDVTGFGNARVNARAPPHALVTLDEVVSLFRGGRLRCELKVKGVASRAVFADPDTRLADAMRTMLDKRIRRLFLRGKKGVFVSDRNILAFLFSPNALAVARRAPGLWMDVSLSAIPSAKASSISPQAKVEEAGSELGGNRDVFVLPDGVSLVSRWDLIMKPWKEGKLTLPH